MKRGARPQARGAGLLVIAAGLFIGACHEIPQDAAKPYAGKEDTKAYAGDRFKGDKDAYEKALAQRAQTQNEYIRTGDAKTR
ncbi:MAG TPA: hypothetical protein VM051_11720 [Usitatibacter sp.]|nr:hypothetical protein [Usitatibacter sp.]